jgi:hypothetical protein
MTLCFPFLYQDQKRVGKYLQNVAIHGANGILDVGASFLNYVGPFLPVGYATWKRWERQYQCSYYEIAVEHTDFDIPCLASGGKLFLGS